MNNGIKYYTLEDGEDFPDMFCALQNIGGEPDNYHWYIPEDDYDIVLKNNEYLRSVIKSDVRKLLAHVVSLEDLLKDVWQAYSDQAESSFHPSWSVDEHLANRMVELGVEVDDG